MGTKANNWEVKGLLPDEDPRRTTIYQDGDYASSFAGAPPRNSNYGGFSY